jgi:hypothetical protein
MTPEIHLKTPLTHPWAEQVANRYAASANFPHIHGTMTINGVTQDIRLTAIGAIEYINHHDGNYVETTWRAYPQRNKLGKQ